MQSQQNRNRFLEHSTFVFPEHRLVFVTLPKVGCTSFKTAIARAYRVKPMGLNGETHPAMWVHNRQAFHRIDAVKGDIPQSHVCLAFVRDPYARLVSAWADKVLLQDLGYWDVTNRTPGSEHGILRAFESHLHRLGWRDAR